MSTTKPTPGKLVPFWNPNLIGTEQLVNGKTRVLLKCDNINGEPGEERATVERIIKCWNALEGVPNPEALMALVRDMAEMGSFPPHEGKGNALRELLGAAIAKAEGK